MPMRFRLSSEPTMFKINMPSPNLLTTPCGGVTGATCFRPALHRAPPSVSFSNRPRRFGSLSATKSMDLGASIRNMNDAGFDMAHHLISVEAKDHNVVFSPLSMYALLSLLTEGASGATKDRLLSFLKAESPSELHSLYSDLIAPVLADGSREGGPKLSTASGIWTDKSVSLKPDFKQVADTVYEADTSQVDFRNKVDEALEQINLWIEKKTQGLIKNILSIHPVTRLVCANALYFNGTWSEAFDKSRTEKYDFHLLDGSRVKVPFMTNSEDQAVCAYDGFKVLQLPYKQGDDKREFSMYMILPDAKDGLPSLVEKVCSQVGFLDSHIPEERVRMDEFWIPKFEMSFEFEALEVLEGMGVVLPSGFSEMVNSVDPTLEVSSIRHKAVIEVDEKGTEAAAVTLSTMFGSCMMYAPLPLPGESFVADHPFMYVIREDTTGSVLFIGQVLNPLLQA